MLGVKEIVEIIEDCLYAVVWKGEERDSFEELEEMLGNPVALKRYLQRNDSYFGAGYYSTSLEETVEKIIEEFDDLADEIVFRAEQGPVEDRMNLGNLFQPLDDRKILLDYKKAKAKHQNSKPIIRIYGYKMDDNCMIISGYGIKLTHKMEDHPDLQKELDKLSVLESYIQENYIVL